MKLLLTILGIAALGLAYLLLPHGAERLRPSSDDVEITAETALVSELPELEQRADETPDHPQPKDEAPTAEEEISTIFDPWRYSRTEIRERFTASLRDIPAVVQYGDVQSLDCQDSSCTLVLRTDAENQAIVQAALMQYSRSHPELGRSVTIRPVEEHPLTYTYTFSNEEPAPE